MDQEEIDSIQIHGGCEEANPFIEKMIKFFLSKKGNLFSFLKTLENQVLENLSKSCDKDKWESIAISLSVMAYSLEQSKYGKEFTVKIETLIKNTQAFIAMCLLALQEKLGIIKVEDKSFFFVMDSPIAITLIGN